MFAQSRYSRPILLSMLTGLTTPPRPINWKIFRVDKFLVESSRKHREQNFEELFFTAQWPENNFRWVKLTLVGNSKGKYLIRIFLSVIPDIRFGTKPCNFGFKIQNSSLKIKMKSLWYEGSLLAKRSQDVYSV